VVVGEADTGEKALDLLQKTTPDLILMDIMMPGIDGLKTTEEIMGLRPTPVLVVSDAVGRSADLNFRALQAGALDVIAKPHERRLEDPELKRRFLRKMHLLAEIPVVTKRRGGDRLPEPASRTERVSPQPPHEKTSILAIGASTGGPPALQVLLSTLNPDLPFPILVVQHMSSGFIGGLAAWLSDVTGRRVVVAEHGTRPVPGSVYLAPDCRHMRYSGGYIALCEDGAGESHCPSIDVLFESIASDSGAQNSIAVILTGMGSDGADGLGRIRRSGGWTIAQDETTSVVFGMPQVAIERNAASEVIPLERIGRRINTMAGAEHGPTPTGMAATKRDPL
jgi:two-component system chemotaxis response regulator CheB